MFSSVPRSLKCCTNALGPKRALPYVRTQLSEIVAPSTSLCRPYHEVTGNIICPNMVRGIDHLRDPRLNKGLAFTLEERQALGIHGLLAAKFKSQEEQLDICRISIDRYEDNLNKYLYLIELQDRNEKLFFRLLSENVEKYLPIVYTPTVGLACQRFGLIYRRPRGLFITINDKGHIFNILKNWPEPDVRAIVFTDGERILGLGDLGAYGMGIPVGKLSLYTALAGIKPHQCLPITLDVGTDNQDLLEDPLYIGLRQRRVRGKEYDEFIDEFMEACVQRYGQNTLLQFEDFALLNAGRLLQKYRNKYCTFNDDIQGTASVAVAGMMAAVRVTKRKLGENIYMFLGAGSASNGIANLIVAAMMSEGLTERQARERVYMFDVDGLLSTRREGGVPEHAKAFGKDIEPEKDFEACVAKIKPSCLIGCSTVGGAFTPNVLKQMAKNIERPIIFALSNPTSKAECTAQDAYDHTEGRCIFASGSPFPPVQHNGKEYHTGQGNNSYIFPGIALGVIATATHHIPETMFLTAARTLANYVSESDLAIGRIYPSLAEVKDVSLAIAIEVAKMAYDEGCSTVGGAFTAAILQQMAKNTDRPIIFALSNPTSKAECTPQQAYDNTNGKCVYVSGSPFPPVNYQGNEFHTGQGNNAYIYPGLALGIIAVRAHMIPDSMFLMAAQTLARLVTEEDLAIGRVYPSLNQICDVSLAIAIDIANMCYENNVASHYPRPTDFKHFIQQQMFCNNYECNLPITYEYPELPAIKTKKIQEVYRSHPTAVVSKSDDNK